MPMLKRQIEHSGVVPRQAAADGGHASKENLAAAHDIGVEDVAFHKKCGLTIEQIARSTWKGLVHFKAYVGLSVVAHNRALLARLEPA